MPKIVDPAQRRSEVAEAVWRVVRRDGLDHASVRNVAREAGLSMGSLRHYFATQSELLIFTLQTVIDRIEQRLTAIPVDKDPRQWAELFLAELLPLDADRVAENQIWLAFTARALVDADLRALRDAAYAGLRGGCRSVVRALVASEVSESEIELEGDRLQALVEGLALNGTLRPDIVTPTLAQAIIARHLDSLEEMRKK